jgi:intracellular sulfur oxidation DsrE/DsrF family protein
MNPDRTPRRGFLARMLAAGAAIGATTIPRVASASAASTARDDEPWMRALSGKHRVIFHSHEPTGALALRWAATFLDTQKSNYGLRDADSSVVVGLNGKSIGLVFNDALWAKYPIGETLAMPGSANPSGPRGNGAVAALIARGVIVLVCHNSLRASGQRFLPEPARGDNAARTAFYEDAKDKLLPGVQLVPAMIVTLQQAQDRGCRYVYAGG